MPIRSVGNATISFGLVSIPVKLYGATSASTGVSFNLLHKACGSRLKQQYVCLKDGTPVERDDMVKGYEYEKDRYVTFTTDELKAIEEKATGAIDIVEFVPQSTVDPVYFDKPYYLGPDKGGDRAYRLLSEAMKRTGRVALAKYPARGKQYLVMLRPSGGGVVMQQLLYADEVRAQSEVPLPTGEVKDSELKLAEQLIAQIASDAFHPEAYRDEVRERMEQEIQRKIAGQDVQAAPESGGSAQVIDIMEALKASLSRRAAEAAPAPLAEVAAPAPAVPVAPPAPVAAAASSGAALPDIGPAPAERKPARRAPRRAAGEAASSSESAAEGAVAGAPADPARKPARRSVTPAPVAPAVAETPDVQGAAK